MTTTQTIPAPRIDYLPAADRAIAAKPELAAKLSPSQLAVLRRLLAGHSEPQIAADFNRSAHTIHDHKKAIYRAVGVNSISGLLLAFFVTP